MDASAQSALIDSFNLYQDDVLSSEGVAPSDLSTEVVSVEAGTRRVLIDEGGTRRSLQVPTVIVTLALGISGSAPGGNLSDAVEQIVTEDNISTLFQSYLSSTIDATLSLVAESSLFFSGDISVDGADPMTVDPSTVDPSTTDPSTIDPSTSDPSITASNSGPPVDSEIPSDMPSLTPSAWS